MDRKARQVPLDSNQPRPNQRLKRGHKRWWVIGLSQVLPNDRPDRINDPHSAVEVFEAAQHPKEGYRWSWEGLSDLAGPLAKHPHEVVFGQAGLPLLEEGS